MEENATVTIPTEAELFDLCSLRPIGARTLGQLCLGDLSEAARAARAASLPEAESGAGAETHLTQPCPCPRLQSEHGTLQPALETGSSTLPRDFDKSWGTRAPDVLGSRAWRGKCAQI